MEFETRLELADEAHVERTARRSNTTLVDVRWAREVVRDMPQPGRARREEPDRYAMGRNRSWREWQDGFGEKRRDGVGDGAQPCSVWPEGCSFLYSVSLPQIGRPIKLVVEAEGGLAIVAH